MQVTKITSPAGPTAPYAREYTQDQLQREFNYMMAEKATKRMLDQGLITPGEYDRIMAENRRTFSTFLAPLL